jgi:nucleoside-diphosphate-sugar epimerase
MRLPGFASDIARFVDRLLQAIGVYHQKIHVLSEMNQSIACSVAKAERELGYEPKIDLAEGMRRSIAWMKKNGQELR